jgi:hypothetical protein
MLPLGEHRRSAKKVEHVALVIAFKANDVMCPRSLDEAVDYVSGCGTSVDIISQKNMKRVAVGIGRKIGVDAGKSLLQQVGAPMNIANGVNSDSFRKAGRTSSGL